MKKSILFIFVILSICLTSCGQYSSEQKSVLRRYMPVNCNDYDKVEIINDYTLKITYKEVFFAYGGGYQVRTVQTSVNDVNLFR